MNKKQSETTKQITVNNSMANITKTRIAPTMVERTENSKRYFTEVRKYNVLTKEEEVEWFDKYHKETDPKEKQKIRDFLINVNLRYAVRIARQYAINGDNVEDLISEANIGLIQAVEKFDSNRDSSFITCAATVYMGSMFFKRFPSALIAKLRSAAVCIDFTMFPWRHMRTEYTNAIIHYFRRKCNTFLINYEHFIVFLLSKYQKADGWGIYRFRR